MSWHAEIDRDLPWKETQDPYKIWLSEIILQQTRVSQGRSYYLKFIERFPCVEDLALATEDEVLSLWKGLGYYSRARNLHTTAKVIVEEYRGVFPKEYQDIIALKGIGKYTAAAIASFAYNQPFAVVDGNVYRVLSRVFGMIDPVDTAQGKNKIHAISDKCIDRINPAEYNQAIMDFGALQCKPGIPDCTKCPMNQVCWVFNNSSPDKYPVKNRKVNVTKRYFNFLLFQKDKSVYLEKRKDKDIWEGLYQLPLIESRQAMTLSEITKEIKKGAAYSNRKKLNVQFINSANQRLTHQLVHGQFFFVQGIKPEHLGKWVELSDIHLYALPKICNDFLILLNDND